MLVDNGWRRMESKLREELKGKDVLLKKKSKKRRARTKAYVDCLVLLSGKEKELKSRDVNTL